ncbi:hypothetical protein BD779DRAFT_825736 [Infundibulicybe gibba]|nr:hypothetical protein BD779DRAFT_825736 [Infundibulicybe gibba]
MAGLQIDEGELAGIAIESVLYGIFLVLDIAALYILFRRRGYRSINKPLVFAAIVMLLLATAQFVVDATITFDAFITISDRPTRQVYINNITVPIIAATHAIYFTMMIVGDVIVIYRCYVVWGYSLRVVAFPILCSVGSGACAYQAIWAVQHPNFNLTVENNMAFPVFSLSFAANGIATSLIAYKIWKADRQLKKTMSIISTRRSLLPAARIIIESGAVNTAYLFIHMFVVYSNDAFGVQIMASIASPLVGIIFTMVIIRATLAADRQAASTTIGNQIPPSGFAVAQLGTTTQRTSFCISTDESSSIDGPSASSRAENLKGMIQIPKHVQCH